MKFLRVRATRGAIISPNTGREITQNDYGEGVQVTPFILREIMAGGLVKAKRLKRSKKKKTDTPEIKEPIDG